MRIDIGPQGRIVGTKRVDASGQVRGLSSFADRDVVILVPDGRPSFHFTLADHLHDWQQLARRGSEQVTKELRALQRRIPSADKVVAEARAQWQAHVVERLPTHLFTQKELRRRLQDLRQHQRVRAAEAWLRENVPASLLPAANAPRRRKKAAA